MELTFTTDGRAILPVRAIPWVAGHEQSTGKVTFPPSLLILSAHTACRAKDISPGTPLLRLYRIDENGAQPVSTENLNATAPESDFQPETDEPLRESTSRLPAGVFVYLDELRSFVDWIFPPGCHDGECRDAITLNTSPDLPDEMIEELQEGFVAPKPNAGSERPSPRKILFWLAPNEILIPADQVPGTIADALYPPTERNELQGRPLNDPNAFNRLLAEREQANLLRRKFPNLSENSSFTIGELTAYLAELGLVAETRNRSNKSSDTDAIGPEGRWRERERIDGFNSIREPVVTARGYPSEASGERCIELAKLQELYIDHWTELVGIGMGKHHSYDIDSECIKFIKHEDEFISLSPANLQVSMMRDNRTAPQLTFPCSPAELLVFVDTAIGIHCFLVPDTFRLAVARNAQAEGERCNELATLPELFVDHWEELTGIGICKGGSYIVSQSGVYPEQYSDDELLLLTTEERRILIEIARRPPLQFPCTPSQLLKFVDGGGQRDFEVPEKFRAAVEGIPKTSEEGTAGAGELLATITAKPKLSRAQTRLSEIVELLEKYAESTNQPFDRQQMPGPLGRDWNDDGSFHWLCAKFDSLFKKAPTTFEKHRAGLCAVQKYAARSDFYKRAWLYIAPTLTPNRPNATTHVKPQFA